LGVSGTQGFGGSLRLAVVLGCLAGINVLLAFFYQWYVLAAIGPGLETDALFAAMAVPQILLAVVTGSLTQVLVPLLSVQNSDNFQKAAWGFFQGIGLISVLLSFVLFITAAEWVPWTVPGFTPETRSLTVTLARIQLIGMVFMGLNGVAWSTCYSKQKFIWAEASPVLGTIGGFAFLIWGLSQFGIVAAAWAMVFRSVIQTFLLLPGLGGYRFPDWRNPAFRDAWRRLYPLLLGTTYYKTGELADRFLASMAPPGQLSLLYFANQIYSAGNVVLNKALAAPMVPLLARKAFEKNWLMFRQISHSRFLWTLGICAAILLCLFFSGPSLYSFVFGHGRFSIDEIVTLHYLLLTLAGVWVGGALGQILASSFYAKGDTVTPTRIGIFGFTLGLGLKAVGFWLWGVLGVAAGTSLYYLLNAFLLKLFLSRKLRQRIADVPQRT